MLNTAEASDKGRSDSRQRKDVIQYSQQRPVNTRRANSKELADIISIIRHAATGGELLTSERRVDKALMKVKSDRAFMEEQEKWLALIRRHLIENLLLEKEDFDLLPIFSREGASWGKLNKVFGGELEKIIREINQAIAA